MYAKRALQWYLCCVVPGSVCSCTPRGPPTQIGCIRFYDILYDYTVKIVQLKSKSYIWPGLYMYESVHNIMKGLLQCYLEHCLTSDRPNTNICVIYIERGYKALKRACKTIALFIGPIYYRRCPYIIEDACVLQRQSRHARALSKCDQCPASS
jgi:hypothetical protein